MRIPLAAVLGLLFSTTILAEPAIHVARVPDDGVQPQLALDSAGTIHLVYFKGDPAHGDFFYVHSSDNGKTFSAPIQVNQNHSAIAIGSIRGAQIAIGRDNRLFVAWNGSDVAAASTAGKKTPMLFARLNDAGNAFEPERNVIAEHFGLDGGGSVAADQKGNVYVAWHAPDKRKAGEANRHVWIARSSDDGKTFSPEINAYPEPTGACGCCGLKLFADSQGDLFALFRSASEMIHRDIYLIRSTDAGATFTGSRLAPMEVGQCIMSSSAIAQASEGVLTAWETQGRVFWAKVADHGTDVVKKISGPAGSKNQKYPALAAAGDTVLLTWAEGTAWNRGGSVAWQLYDAKGNRLGEKTTRPNLPTWSFPAVAADKNGDFLILY